MYNLKKYAVEGTIENFSVRGPLPDGHIISTHLTWEEAVDALWDESEETRKYGGDVEWSGKDRFFEKDGSDRVETMYDVQEVITV